jgi:hypothetical protein
MSQTTPSLPSGFLVEGYYISKVVREEGDSILYEASAPDGQAVLIREFCPHGLAQRDPESGKLRYAVDDEVRNELMSRKEKFDETFPPGPLGQFAALGTVYNIDPVQVEQPVATRSSGVKPVVVSKKKKDNALFRNLLILLVVLGGGYFGYQSLLSSSDSDDHQSKVTKKSQGSHHKQVVETTSNETDVQQSPDSENQIAEEQDDSNEASANAESDIVSPEDAGAEVPAANVVEVSTPDVSEEVDEQPDVVAKDEGAVTKAKKKDKPQEGRREGRKNSGKIDQLAVQQWIKTYAKRISESEFNKKYSDVWQSWFGDSDEVAQKYITVLGPLGIRARQLDSSWSSVQGFKNLFPKSLCDPDGELVLNGYTVINTIAGGPGDGKVKEGDFIIGVDGQLLKSAAGVETKYGPYQHQGTRGLDLHMGLLVDKAEGVGKIKLMVIPAENLDKLPPLKNKWRNVVPQTKVDKDFDLSVPVKGGQIVRLIVDDGGNGIGSDGFEWENLRLEGPKGTVSFDKRQPCAYNVGYGQAKFNPETHRWFAHANSVLAFEIPQGEWTLKGKSVKAPYASVNYKVDVCDNNDVPAEIKKFCKNVELKIDRIGSYADGFPNKCPKSRAVVEMLSQWLLAQQNDDGSIDHYGGYTTKHFDTALAGLAWMSTGEKKFDPAIKKAAEYCAFSGTQDWWAVPAGTEVVFLSEYWLRYRDDSILPALRNQVERMKNEMLYGEFATGHGIHPGYRGTGVSIGGSTMTLALAIASRTPAKIDDGIADKMLDRAQELCPSGFGPYGRRAETLQFTPNLETGGTYSGRHGPYFLGSIIAGGPELFTRNCRAMYANGPIGGADQGHSSETLSMLWAMPSYWVASPETYYKSMESYRWKLTLLRAFDGGLIFNPNRTEYQGAEPCLQVFIRTAAWILGLCAERQNLAITGKPEFRAKSFRNVPPIFDHESRLIHTYTRNWAIASTVLGTKAPEGLKSIREQLKKVPIQAGCRYPLMEIISKNGVAVAKSILALKDVDPLLRAYCAELVLGVDIRLTCEPKTDGDKIVSGEYIFAVDVQQPMSGRAIGLRDKEEEKKALELLKWPFEGSVTFEGGNISGLTPVTWDSKSNYKDEFNVFSSKQELPGPELKEPMSMKAHIKYKVADVEFDYVRPLKVGAFEAGCGEKERKVVNDRHFWVPGILYRDHGNWGMNFYLQDGTFISSATQGNQVIVHEKVKGSKDEKVWVSPNDASLLQGSKCLFLVSTDWFGLEVRCAELKLLNNGNQEIHDYKIKTSAEGDIDTKDLVDSDSTTFTTLKYPEKEGESLDLDITLPKPIPVRAVDVRLKEGSSRLVIEALKNGKMVPVYWGTQGASTGGAEKTMEEMFSGNSEVQRMLTLPGNGWIKSIRAFTPVTTNKLRIRFIRENKNQKGGELKLSELRVYTTLATKHKNKESANKAKPQA